MQVLTSTIFIKPLPASSISNLRYFTWLPGFYGDNCFLKVKIRPKKIQHDSQLKRHRGEPWEEAKLYLGRIHQPASSWIKKRRKVLEMLTPLWKKKGEPPSHVRKGICPQQTTHCALQLKTIGETTMICRLMDELSKGNTHRVWHCLSLKLCLRTYFHMTKMGLYWWFKTYSWPKYNYSYLS